MSILEKVFLVVGVPKLLALLHPICQDLAGGHRLEVGVGLIGLGQLLITEPQVSDNVLVRCHD